MKDRIHSPFSLLSEGRNLKDRLEHVQARIKQAAEACNRSVTDIRLVAVSKTMPVEIVQEAIETGMRDFGENYIQEAREKITALATYPVTWHYIGHLQSNKAKYADRMFDLIHSVDSLKLAKALDKYAKKIDKVQNILIQVNIAKEDSKSGVYGEDTLQLAREIARLENLAVKGLMTMPPYFNAPEKVRPIFAALRHLRDQIKNENIPNISMEDLSMGMTGDFEAAIEEGATMVRVGTAIFGERH
jgi:pyridoxal phosphate enzyme (YggS family)